MKFLRIKKIEHSAIFSQDGKPLTILDHSTSQYIINKHIFNQLHIRLEHLNTFPNVIHPLPFDDSKDTQQTSPLKEEQNLGKVEKINNGNSKEFVKSPRKEQNMDVEMAEEIVVESVLE